jgi:hypothetical protein
MMDLVRIVQETLCVQDTWTCIPAEVYPVFVEVADIVADIVTDEVTVEPHYSRHMLKITV